MRKGPGRKPASGEKLHKSPWGIKYYAHNTPGSKVARKAIEHAGRDWNGEIFHGGELTKASKRKALERLGFQLIDA